MGRVGSRPGYWSGMTAQRNGSLPPRGARATARASLKPGAPPPGKQPLSEQTKSEINPARKAGRAVSSVGQLSNVAKVAVGIQREILEVAKTLQGPQHKAARCECAVPRRAQGM